MIEPGYATATLEEDVERVRAVREAVLKTRIAIDANNAWTPPVALRSCGKWSRLTSPGWRSR